MPYREPPIELPPPPKPPPRSRWARLLCSIGIHEGPFIIGLHVIECFACKRVVSD